MTSRDGNPIKLWAAYIGNLFYTLVSLWLEAARNYIILHNLVLQARFLRAQSIVAVWKIDNL